jgi:hypothetical protein
VTSHNSALGKDLCRSGGVFRDVKILLNGSSRIPVKIKIVCEAVESRLRRDGGRILLSGSSRILVKIKIVCEAVESRILNVRLRQDIIKQLFPNTVKNQGRLTHARGGLVPRDELRCSSRSKI